MANDLELEISRLEARLGDDAAAASAPVIDELARIRRDLASGQGRRGPLRLANLRIASPCQERWGDMVGDDRVRACGRCERPVFDLSELTREQAEAVLATRGVTPCVRFYRRDDGTVMTADCAPAARGRFAAAAGAVAAGAVLAGASPALAEPPEPPPPSEIAAPSGTPPPSGVTIDREYTGGIPVPGRSYTLSMGVPPSSHGDGYGVAFSGTGDGAPAVAAMPEEPPHRPTIEWSSWVRLGYGREQHAAAGLARTVGTAPHERSATWDAALGADVSVPLRRDGDLRLGAWTEVRTSSAPVLGAELLVESLPGDVGVFAPEAAGVLALRVGGNPHVVTAAVAYGTIAPWGWSGAMPGASRYMVGVRAVASATRSLDDPREWTATAGVEVEPFGLVRSLLRSR